VAARSVAGASDVGERPRNRASYDDTESDSQQEGTGDGEQEFSWTPGVGG